MHKLDLEKYYLHIETKQLGTQGFHEKIQNMETIQKYFDMYNYVVLKRGRINLH
jgi:hypothetical protein